MRARNLLPGLLLLSLILTSTLPAVQAFHGAWWRARDLAASNAVMGLGHAGHEVSTATEALSGEVLRADIEWSGQQGLGLHFDGTVTIKFYDADGALVHLNVVPSNENINNVQWIACPEGTGDPGDDLETLPSYFLGQNGPIVPIQLAIGPGAPGGSGMMRNSFCDGDPFFFQAFSDYTGSYLNQYALHLHVRGEDHG